MKVWTYYVVSCLSIAAWNLQGCSQEVPIGTETKSESGRASASELSRLDANCVVTAGTTQLKQAVCAHDAQLLRNSLFGLQGDKRTEAINVLHAIWIESDEAGTSLPWGELKRLDFRLAYAPILVESVRSGDKNLPLKAFQELALEGATKNAGNLEEIEAIRLVGLANAEEQIPFLLKKVKENPSPYASHLTAIEALGYICGEESLRVLNQVRNDLANDPKDRQAVERAFQHRHAISGTWCR